MPKSVLLGVYPTKGERVALIPVEADLPQRVELFYILECSANYTVNICHVLYVCCFIHTAEKNVGSLPFLETIGFKEWSMIIGVNFVSPTILISPIYLQFFGRVSQIYFYSGVL